MTRRKRSQRRGGSKSSSGARGSKEHTTCKNGESDNADSRVYYTDVPSVETDVQDTGMKSLGASKVLPQGGGKKEKVLGETVECEERASPTAEAEWPPSKERETIEIASSDGEKEGSGDTGAEDMQSVLLPADGKKATVMAKQTSQAGLQMTIQRQRDVRESKAMHVERDERAGEIRTEQNRNISKNDKDICKNDKKRGREDAKDVDWSKLDIFGQSAPKPYRKPFTTGASSASRQLMLRDETSKLHARNGRAKRSQAGAPIEEEKKTMGSKGVRSGGEGVNFRCGHCNADQCHMWVCSRAFEVVLVTAVGSIQERRDNLYASYDKQLGPAPRTASGSLQIPFCIFMTIERIVRNAVSLQIEVFGELDSIKQGVCVMYYGKEMK